MEFVKRNLQRFRSSTKAQGFAVALLFGLLGLSYILLSQAASPVGPVVGTGGKCLDNRFAKLTNENPIVLYKCNKTSAQQWTYVNDNLKIGEYCLDVPGASKSPQKYVQLYKCNKTKAQVWVQKSNGALVNPNSGLCLDNQYSLTVDLNPIWTYQCNGTAAQKWTLPATTSQTPKPTPTPAPIPPVVNNTPLPFSRAPNEVLRASSKKVFAHYFTPYPLQINNVDSSVDYYTKNYLTQNGENGKHAAYGGLLRERPLPQPVGGAGWELENMKTEVRRAADAGIDGFSVDILAISGYNWERTKILIQAANAVDPGFKIMLMPDANAGAADNATALAHAMSGLAKGPYGSSIFKLADGRVVVSPFKAEGKSVDFWKTFINVMKSDGVNVAFVPCFLNYGANADAFAPISYGFSNWGNRNPDGNKLAALTNLSKDAHARGKIWMQPVSVQDSRPRSGAYWEANNTENMRATWAAANEGSDWVQIPTWNDYSESAQIAPSTHIGWSLLDINAYYISRYKLGLSQPITKDVLYVSHRVHPAAAKPTGGQTVLQTVRASTPPRDKVEVMAFLRQASTLEITVGGVKTTVTAPAGVSTHLVDLKPGAVSAKAVVNNGVTASVVSPFPVVANPVVQDMQYYYVSSARDNNGLGDYSDSMKK